MRNKNVVSLSKRTKGEKTGVSDVLKKLKFGMYKHSLVLSDNSIDDRWFIALKDRESDTVLELTPLTVLIRQSGSSIDARTSQTIRLHGNFTCTFLNYVLIDNYDKFKINEIKDITVEMGNLFLKDYADGVIGGDKGKTLETVKIAEYKLCRLYATVKKIYKRKAKHIYNIQWYKSEDSDGKKARYISPFSIRVNNPKENPPIFRDMPSYIFDKFIELSKIHYPELTFAIALQAYGGLRPGEVCNVRQAICDNGDGVAYKLVGDECVMFEVDLRKVYRLRSDDVDVGGIKKKRKQKIYTKYTNELYGLYQEHLVHLSKIKQEPGFYPMFVGKNGKALTVKSYREKIHRLIEILKIELSKSDKSKYRYYSQLLIENKLSPHFLRHYFTVRLVLNNEPPHMVAKWRGDSNLETALIYCGNKEELLDAIMMSNERLANKAFNYKLDKVLASDED